MYGDAKYSTLLQHLDELWQTVDEVGDVTLVGQTVTSIAAAAHHLGRRDLIMALLPRIQARAYDGGTSRESGEMYALAAKLQCVYGDADLAWAAVDGAERIAKNSGDRVIELLASIGRGVTELIFGDLELSRAAYSRAYSICQDPEMAAYRERLLGDYGWVLFEVGRTEESIAVLTEAARKLASHRMLYALANLCLVQYETCQFALLKKSAERLIEANNVLQAGWVEISALAFDGLAAIGLRSHDRAHRIAERLFHAVQRSPVTRITDSCWVEMFNAVYLDSIGYREHAARLLVAAAECSEPRDRLVRMRFMLRLARICTKDSPDRAWRLARDVEVAALACNAHRLAATAQQIRMELRN
jgi:hypothetical protein